MVLGLTTSPPLFTSGRRDRGPCWAAALWSRSSEWSWEGRRKWSLSRFSLFFSFLCWDLSLVSFPSTRLSCLDCITEIAEGWHVYSNLQIWNLLASCTINREASGFYDNRCSLILQICSEKEIHVHGLHRVYLGAPRGWPHGRIIDVLLYTPANY